MSDASNNSREIGKYVLPIMPSIEGIGPTIDRQLGRAFAGVSQQASRALADGVRDGVKEAEAAVKKSSESIAKLRDQEAAAADKLATAEARIEEVRERGGSALRRAEAQRNAAQRQQQAALREIEQQTRSLERAQQSLTEAQEEAARGGERAGAGFLAGLRGNLSGAGSAGSDAAASFAEGFAGSAALLRLGSAGGPIGLALAAAGVIGGGLLVRSVLAGIEREPARDLVQAQLGIDEASMRRVSESAGRVYADNFGQSRDEVLEASKVAFQQGLIDPQATAAEWEPTVQKLLAINDLIGGDLASTSNTIRTLWKSGVAPDIASAFDIITAASQRGLGEDIMDSLTEYASGWRNAGLTAKQGLALIAQASEHGVDVSDRSADALREFGRRISEEGDTIVAVLDNIGLDGESMFEAFVQGGPAGFRAFDAVFDRIRAIEDPVRRNQAAMALLGDTAGDFIGAFTKWDPSQAVTSFGDIEGAAQDAADTMGDNVAGSFESARRSIEVSVGRVQDALADGFGPTLQNIADWVREHEDDITGFFFDLGDFALLGVKSVVKATAEGTRAFAQLVNAVGDAYGGITTAIAGLNDLLGRDEIADQLRKDAEAGFGLADGIYEIADQADAAVSEIDTWRDALRDAEGAAGDAKDATDGLGDKLGQLPRKTDVVLNVTDGTGRPLPLDGSGRGWWTPGNGAGGGPLSINTPAGQNPLLDQARDQFGLAPGQAAPPLPGLPGGILGGGGKGFLGIYGIGSGSPDAERWRPMVRQALAQYGPAYGVTNFQAWEDALVQQIKTESGGNPASVNPNDTDGRGGTQRVAGILNFLQSTYDANNVTGLPYMDPYGQIAAAIAYVSERWGVGPDGRPNQIGRGQGFEYGGAVFGGTRGKDSVPALLAGDEHVVTTGEVDAAGGHGTWYRLRAMARAGMLRGFETGGAVSPQIQQIAQIAAGFGLDLTSGRRDEQGSFHNTGEAGDFSNGVRTEQELAFATFMAQNYGASLAELIYDDPRFGMEIDEGKVVPRSFFAAAGDHTNHVHIAVRGAGGGQQLGTTSLSAGMGMPTSGPTSPYLTSAFGAGFQPGIGTPGYNDFGEPGYYQTDPRSIAQADRRARDAQRSIADADQAVADAEARRAEIEKDITTSAEDRAKADRDIERAREAASRAREDAQWAEADAEEARRGKFTAAREARQQDGQQGGSGDLSGLGGIFGSFLKETFGLDGSLFPDLSNLMPVKMFGAAMGAFKGPLQGLIDGQLGIQQPGWTPGAPVQTPASASGLPFGMVPSPFDFAGGQVDQSRHVSIQVDSGPTSAEIGDVVRREVNNVDRLHTYVPPGS